MLSNKAKRELKINQRRILIDSIEIAIPAPQQILNWGERSLPNGKKVGEVKNSKTVNYKKFTPLRDGLFCERIFGPINSYMCACGKRQSSSDLIFCDKCEVEYIDKGVRRSRLGYISLVSPVVHVWYLKGRPSYLSLFLGKRKKQMIALAYCNAYLVEQAFSNIDKSIQKSLNQSFYKYRNDLNFEHFTQSRNQIQQLSNKFYKVKRITTDSTFFKQENEGNSASVSNLLKSQKLPTVLRNRTIVSKESKELQSQTTDFKDKNNTHLLLASGNEVETNKILLNLPLTTQIRTNKWQQTNAFNSTKKTSLFQSKALEKKVTFQNQVSSVNKKLLDSFLHVFVDILSHTKNNFVLNSYAHTLPSLSVTRSKDKQFYLLDFYLQKSSNLTSFFDFDLNLLPSAVDKKFPFSAENPNTDTLVRDKQRENFIKKKTFIKAKRYQTTPQKVKNLTDFAKQKLVIKNKEQQSTLLKGVSIPILSNRRSVTSKPTLHTKKYFLNFSLPSYLWYRKRYFPVGKLVTETKSQADLGYLLTPFAPDLLHSKRYQKVSSQRYQKVKNKLSGYKEAKSKDKLQSNLNKSILNYFTKTDRSSSVLVKKNSNLTNNVENMYSIGVSQESRELQSSTNLALSNIDKNESCFFLHTQTPQKQIKQYNRGQSLPFLPSLICKYNVREELVTFFKSSPIKADVAIPFYCQTGRWQALSDVHKFMAEQSLSSSSLKKESTKSFGQKSKVRKKINKSDFLLWFAQQTNANNYNLNSNKYVQTQLNSERIYEQLKNYVNPNNERWKSSITKSIPISNSIQALKTYSFGSKLFSFNEIYKTIDSSPKILDFAEKTDFQNTENKNNGYNKTDINKFAFYQQKENKNQINQNEIYYKVKPKSKRIFTLGSLVNLSCHFAWQKFNSTLENQFSIFRDSNSKTQTLLPIEKIPFLPENLRERSSLKQTLSIFPSSPPQSSFQRAFAFRLCGTNPDSETVRSNLPESIRFQNYIKPDNRVFKGLITSDSLQFTEFNDTDYSLPPIKWGATNLNGSLPKFRFGALEGENLEADRTNPRINSSGDMLYQKNKAVRLQQSYEEKEQDVTKSKIFGNINFSVLFATQVANRIPKMMRIEKIQTQLSKIFVNNSLEISETKAFGLDEISAINPEILTSLSISSRASNLASIYSRLFYLLFSLEKRLLHNVYTPFFEKGIKQVYREQSSLKRASRGANSFYQSFALPKLSFGKEDQVSSFSSLYQDYVAINKGQKNDLISNKERSEKSQKSASIPQPTIPLSLFLIPPRLKAATIYKTNNVTSLAVQKFNPIFEKFSQQKIENLSAVSLLPTTLSEASLPFFGASKDTITRSKYSLDLKNGFDTLLNTNKRKAKNQNDKEQMLSGSKNSKLYLFIETRGINPVLNSKLSIQKPLKNSIDAGLNQLKPNFDFEKSTLLAKNFLNICNLQIQPITNFVKDIQQKKANVVSGVKGLPKTIQEGNELLGINEDFVSENQISQFVLTRNILFATLVTNKTGEQKTLIDPTIFKRKNKVQSQEKQLVVNLRLEKKFLLNKDLNSKELDNWNLFLKNKSFQVIKNKESIRSLALQMQSDIKIAKNSFINSNNLPYPNLSTSYNNQNTKYNTELKNGENILSSGQNFGIQGQNIGKQAETLSYLELNTIREILAYTGGGGLEAYLKRINIVSFFNFLAADIASTRIFYKEKLAKTTFGNQMTRKQKRNLTRLARRISLNSRRLKIIQLFLRNKRRPEWMMISFLPVLPPDLRPILQMSENVVVASDINNLYQRVIYRNNRFHKLGFIDSHLVTAIQRLVQDAVDRLIENGKGASKPFYTPAGRPLKSLSDTLKGKKGRFRYNLLGKRVDFSGRSVIVVSPQLQIQECGLPKEIALELYHYFLLRQILLKRQASSIVIAKKIIKERKASIWNMLRELIYYHPVLLNRAPTLHRLGIQAFQPRLINGNAIWLHPLVCSAFNADFDGDQMGVHLPLSLQARAEAWDLLWSRNNLLSPATGQPVLVPSQDMVLGFYYMTQSFASPCLASEQNVQKSIKSNTPTSVALPSQTMPNNAKPLQQQSIEPSLGDFNKPYKNEVFARQQSFLPKQNVGKSYKEPKSKAFRVVTNPTFFDGRSIRILNVRQLSSSKQFFLNKLQILNAFQNGHITIHTPVWLALKCNEHFEHDKSALLPLELRINTYGTSAYIYSEYKRKKDESTCQVTSSVRTTAGKVVVNKYIS